MEDLEHDDEDRELQQQRETRGQRIDLVLLVELHHLFVQLLAIATVLLLQPSQLRLQPLHLEHALGGLQLEGCGDEHHHQCDHRDGEDVVVGEVVELGQQPGRSLEQTKGDHASARFRRKVSGTGSHPDGPNGRQRRKRRRVRSSPRPVPYCCSDSRA